MDSKNFCQNINHIIKIYFKKIQNLMFFYILKVI